MTIACAIAARRFHLSILEITDTVALCGTPGLFFGRLGNFINGELYGRPSNVPWAMVFPADPLQVPRHPSQLYEALTADLKSHAIRPEAAEIEDLLHAVEHLYEELKQLN